MAYRNISFLELLDRIHRDWQSEYITRNIQDFDRYVDLDTKVVGIHGHKIRSGKFYTFKYLPKHRASLNVYDLLPVVLILDVKPTGFRALNFHYLNQWRVYDVFLKQILMEKLRTRMRNEERLLISSKLLNTILNSNVHLKKYAMQGVRNYLFSQLRSRFYQISSEYWEELINLPVAKWKRDY